MLLVTLTSIQQKTKRFFLNVLLNLFTLPLLRVARLSVINSARVRDNNKGKHKIIMKNYINII